jgi:hypothetical protein
MKKKVFLTILFVLIAAVVWSQPSNSPFGPVPPDNTPYNAATWDGSWSPPTQNAVRDQIETMLGGGIDHGTLGGLGDDDHTQYFLADGSRDISGSITPDAGNSYDLGSALDPFRNGHFSGTVNSPIFTGGIAATQSGSSTLHHAGIMTWWDSGNNTSVVLGPVNDDTTTLPITGSLDISGSVNASGFIPDANYGVDFSNNVDGGYVTALTITNGGTGYSDGTLSATGGGGSGFAGTYTVTAGVITDVTITDYGLAYTSAPTIVISDAGNGDAVITPHMVLVTSSTLIKYQAGTWQPRLYFLNEDGAECTYHINDGVWSRIGDTVTVLCTIELTSKGTSTGQANVSGLPFPCYNNSMARAPVTLYIKNITFADLPIGFVPEGSRRIRLYETTNAGAVSSITDADFANDSLIRLSVTYQTE